MSCCYNFCALGGNGLDPEICFRPGDFAPLAPPAGRCPCTPPGPWRPLDPGLSDLYSPTTFCNSHAWYMYMIVVSQAALDMVSPWYQGSVVSVLVLIYMCIYIYIHDSFFDCWISGCGRLGIFLVPNVLCQCWFLRLQLCTVLYLYTVCTCVFLFRLR